jgi:hypothetical protein
MLPLRHTPCGPTHQDRQNRSRFFRRCIAADHYPKLSKIERRRAFNSCYYTTNAWDSKWNRH